MIAVRCPKVTTPRGERLLSERAVTSLQAVADAWLLTVRCPCGEEHPVAVRRALPLAVA